VDAGGADTIVFRDEQGYVPWSEYAVPEWGRDAPHPYYSPWQLLYFNDAVELPNISVQIEWLLDDERRATLGPDWRTIPPAVCASGARCCTPSGSTYSDWKASWAASTRTLIEPEVPHRAAPAASTWTWPSIIANTLDSTPVRFAVIALVEWALQRAELFHQPVRTDGEPAVGCDAARDVPMLRRLADVVTDGRSHSDALVGCMVWSTTASSSAVRVSRSTCWRSRALNA
jgi:hypothetical protein